MVVSYDKYNSVAELVHEIDSNFDIEFEFEGRKFSICPSNSGPSIAEWYNEDETEKKFKNGNELVENYVINGHLLQDIVTELNIISH